MNFKEGIPSTVRPSFASQNIIPSILKHEPERQMPKISEGDVLASEVLLVGKDLFVDGELGTNDGQQLGNATLVGSPNGANNQGRITPHAVMEVELDVLSKELLKDHTERVGSKSASSIDAACSKRALSFKLASLPGKRSGVPWLGYFPVGPVSMSMWRSVR